MTRRNGLLALILGTFVPLITIGLSLQAQQHAEPGPNPAARQAGRSVQDALSRPFTFPFVKPTSLEQVVAFLGRELQSPVVLDRAGLSRVDVRPDDTVQLELQGARLKTGLKLLLDQLDLTYRVEPDDNLLIITDARGSDDPFTRVLDELSSLHAEVHDLQDSVDEVRSALGLEPGGERVRKPTIIEEVPPGEGGKPREAPPSGAPPTARSRPGL